MGGAKSEATVGVCSGSVRRLSDPHLLASWEKQHFTELRSTDSWMRWTSSWALAVTTVSRTRYGDWSNSKSPDQAAAALHLLGPGVTETLLLISLIQFLLCV